MSSRHIDDDIRNLHHDDDLDPRFLMYRNTFHDIETPRRIGDNEFIHSSSKPRGEDRAEETLDENVSMNPIETTKRHMSSKSSTGVFEHLDEMNHFR